MAKIFDLSSVDDDSNLADNYTSTDFGFFGVGDYFEGLALEIKHLNTDEAIVSGTGVYTPFLHVDTNGPTTRGFNTDEKVSGSDYKIDDLGMTDSSTQALRLRDVPIVYLDLNGDATAEAYYEVRLDINEPNNTQRQVSLEELQIFTSTSQATITDYHFDEGNPLAFTNTPGNDGTTDFILRFDLDSGEDRTLILQDNSNGSGRDDYIFYLPVSSFAGALQSDYFTLFSQFGPDPAEHGGFEEWRIQTASKIEGIKFEDLDNDGVQDIGDPGEQGLGGVTVYIDVDGDNKFDAGELSTVTASDGTFTFYGLLGSGNGTTYTIREVLTEDDLADPATQSGALPTGEAAGRAWDLTTGDASGDHNVIITTAGNYFVSIGNHELVPHIYIDKSAKVNNGDACVDGLNDVINYTVRVSLADFALVNPGPTSDVSLTNVFVTDAFEDGSTRILDDGDGILELGEVARQGDDGDNILEAGETWTYTYSRAADQEMIDTNGYDGDGDLDNEAAVVAEPVTAGTAVGDTDVATVAVCQDPDFTAVKEIVSVNDGADAGGDNGKIDGAGDSVTYKITITNTGNVTLTLASVLDTFEGDEQSIVALMTKGNGDNFLDVGETWTYEWTETVSQTELDELCATDETITNSLAATFTFGEKGTEHYFEETKGNTVETPVECTPDFTAVKEIVSVNDGADAGGDNGKIDGAGDSVTYKITITNTGNVTLTLASVLDTFEGDEQSIVALMTKGNGDNFLDVGETWTYEWTETVSQTELDELCATDETITNSLAATFTFGEKGTEHYFEETKGNTVETPVVCNPAIDLEKYVNVGAGFVDADYVDGNPFPLGPQNVNVGTAVDFRLTIENTGNVTLTNVVITDVNTSNNATPGTTVTLFENGALTDYAKNTLNATLVGDTNGDGKLQVDETWTIEYTTAFDAGQHLNTAYVTTFQGAEDDDNAAYYSLVDDCPGVRTPGFWQQWTKLWDGDTSARGTPKQQGTVGFPDHDLLYVDKDHDPNTGVGGYETLVQYNGQKGLLIGDWNLNGMADANEDVFFISLSDAQTLVGTKVGSSTMSDGVVKLGRDVVATWLNFLAGSDVGDRSDPNSPAALLDDAIDWLQTFGGQAGNGDANKLGDNDQNEIFDQWYKNHTKVGMTTDQWTKDLYGTDIDYDDGDPTTNDPDHDWSAQVLHENLDEYNNDGTTFDGAYFYCHDGDDAMAMAALAAIA